MGARRDIHSKGVIVVVHFYQRHFQDIARYHPPASDSRSAQAYYIFLLSYSSLYLFFLTSDRIVSRQSPASLSVLPRRDSITAHDSDPSATSQSLCPFIQHPPRIIGIPDSPGRLDLHPPPVLLGQHFSRRDHEPDMLPRGPMPIKPGTSLDILPPSSMRHHRRGYDLIIAQPRGLEDQFQLCRLRDGVTYSSQLGVDGGVVPTAEVRAVEHGIEFGGALGDGGLGFADLGGCGVQAGVEAYDDGEAYAAAFQGCCGAGCEGFADADGLR